jgi:hypothetical protein
VKQVGLEESVSSVCQVALWHDPHIGSEQHDGPTSYCPWDDYISRGILPPMYLKWHDKEGKEPAPHEARPISDELRVHWDNYCIVEKIMRGKIVELVADTHNITGMHLVDACSTVEQECERLEHQIERQLSVYRNAVKWHTPEGEAERKRYGFAVPVLR